MRGTRAVLLGLWLVLIVSLFWDPWTDALTRPDAAGSPFRVDASQPVLVQGRALPVDAYPMGARIFWTMLIPIIPLFLMLFGHETWRRICPLSLSTQLGQLTGLQNKRKVLNRRTGRVERKLRLIRSGSPLARNVWFLQFGFLWVGITGRLLFINSDRTILALFLLGMIGLAVATGVLFGGKTWCNYVCPISVVQKIYTGPGGLLESKAYRARSLSQATCRKPGPTGDQSTCVGCAAACPDIDLERSYWTNLLKPGRRFAYYGYFGLVVAFYTYYRLYAGNWRYYFSGAWTHEPGQLRSLLSPGFYVHGQPIAVPKLLAAPLTTAAFVLGAYALGVLLERVYGAIRSRLGSPLSIERLRHQGLTVSAFATFNAFYLFGGRPNLNLLTPEALKIVDVGIVVISTLWLGRSLRAASAVYRRESLAQSMLRQLGRLKMDFSKILEGRTLEDLSADEVYMLSRTLSSLPDDKRALLYRDILRDALARGEVSGENSLEALREIRQQLGVGDDEHERVMTELLRSEPGIVDSTAADPGRLRLANYRSALEIVVSRCLDSGRPVREQLGVPPNGREVSKLREIFGVSDSEHEGVLSEILDRGSLLLREARVLLEEVARATLKIAALSGGAVSSGVEGLDLLVHHLERRRRSSVVRLCRLLAADSNDREAVALAYWLNVAAGGRALDALQGANEDPREPPGWRVPEATLRVLQEAAGRVEPLRDDEDVADLSELGPLMAERLEARDVLAELSSGRGAATATALHVLRQIDPALAKSAAREALAASDRHWLVDEVAESVLGRARRATAAVATAPPRPAEADFRVEPSSTVTKMTDLFRSEFFRHLSLEVLATLARRAEVRVYRRGGVVCRTGDPPDHVHVIRHGAADIFVQSEGRDVWTNAVADGDSIGELGVLTQRPRAATVVVSREDSRLISIGGDDLLSVLNRSATSAMSFLRLLSTRQQGMLAKISEP